MEFISAAEGNPKQSFWQEIVKRNRVERLIGRSCGRSNPTTIDGWILKFFPNEYGYIRDSVYMTTEMPSDRVRVNFKYRIKAPNGTIIKETPMELWAGFIGTEMDTITNTITPKIGWLVRKAESEEEMLKKLKDEDTSPYGISLNIKEVPEVLSRMEHIKRLSIGFTNDVVLPEWFYNLTIDKLTISGKMTDEVKARILEHFPEAKIYAY